MLVPLAYRYALIGYWLKLPWAFYPVQVNRIDTIYNISHTIYQIIYCSGMKVQQANTHSETRERGKEIENENYYFRKH